MLKILKGQQEYLDGVVVCEESKNASCLPLVIHFLGAAVESNKKVCLISSRMTDMNYRLICSKVGVRWNPANISFSEVVQPGYSFDTEVKVIMDDIFTKITEVKPEFVIFDDLSILESFGATEIETSLYIHKIYEFLTTTCETPLLFAPFSSSPGITSLLKPYTNLHIEIITVGHGFAKDATSKAILTHRDSSFPKKAILLSGERTNNGQWVSI